jgi:D-alanyl-D-alanine carboxypeptidase/D-alanyl-D-alanine-endopeptidase (penicillin-binding protein 4)
MNKKYLLIWILFIGLLSCNISKKATTQSILLNDSIVKSGHLGISIYEPATQKYWYNYNAEKLFIPASNTKLFTLYAGMKFLDEQLTGIYYNDTRDTFFVLPSGDPTFLHPDFLNQPVFEMLKTNQKPIVIINQNQQIQPYGKGWAWDDASEAYMAQRNAFPIYGNLLHLNWVKKNEISNESFAFDLKLLNGNVSDFEFLKKSDTAIAENVIIKTPAKNKFEVALNGNSTQINQEVPFETNGIEMTANLLKQKLGKSLFIKTEEINKEAFKPLYSQRTDTFFKIMMHRSDNFYAEQTLLIASEKQLGYMSETGIIDTLLKSTFKDLPQQPRWVDGSGLSRYNLFSPKDFIYILNKLQSDFGYEKLEYILPTGGKGTLANYFKSDSGFIFAKTGSLSNNFTLCGFIKTRKNKTLLFSIMLNNYIGSGKLLRKQFENYLHEIIQQN